LGLEWVLYCHNIRLLSQKTATKRTMSSLLYFTTRFNSVTSIAEIILARKTKYSDLLAFVRRHMLKHGISQEFASMAIVLHLSSHSGGDTGSLSVLRCPASEWTPIKAPRNAGTASIVAGTKQPSEGQNAIQVASRRREIKIAKAPQILEISII
jgi:hypothetical protein